MSEEWWIEFLSSWSRGEWRGSGNAGIHDRTRFPTVEAAVEALLKHGDTDCLYRLCTDGWASEGLIR